MCFEFFLIRNEHTTYKSAQNKKENKGDFLIDNTCKTDWVKTNVLMYFSLNYAAFLMSLR